MPGGCPAAQVAAVGLGQRGFPHRGAEVPDGCLVVLAIPVFGIGEFAFFYLGFGEKQIDRGFVLFALGVQIHFESPAALWPRLRELLMPRCVITALKSPF
jgi:hypothetical protein